MRVAGWGGVFLRFLGYLLGIDLPGLADIAEGLLGRPFSNNSHWRRGLLGECKVRNQKMKLTLFDSNEII